MPIAALAGATIGGSIISGLFGKSAADTQAQAAQQASTLEAQNQQQALQVQQQEFAQQQANQAPFLQAGDHALSSLNSLLAPGGALTQQYGAFQAPTEVTEQNDPGYQFRLQQGADTLQKSAAAMGGLLTGGTARGLENYAQQDASNEYGNVYSRALQDYQTNYNTFQQNQANQYNRLANIAGLGQTAVGQLGQAGTAEANATGNTLLAGGAQIGQDIQNAAYQRGSGYAALGNALGGSVSNLGAFLSLNNLLQNQSGGAAPTAANPGNGLGNYDPNQIYAGW